MRKTVRIIWADQTPSPSWQADKPDKAEPGGDPIMPGGEPGGTFLGVLEGQKCRKFVKNGVQK